MKTGLLADLYRKLGEGLGVAGAPGIAVRYDRVEQGTDLNSAEIATIGEAAS
jgi:hypothetical protein